MNGQVSCEGPQGRGDTLTSKLPDPASIFRKDFDSLEKIDPADVATHMGYK